VNSKRRYPTDSPKNYVISDGPSASLSSLPIACVASPSLSVRIQIGIRQATQAQNNEACGLASSSVTKSLRTVKHSQIHKAQARHHRGFRVNAHRSRPYNVRRRSIRCRRKTQKEGCNQECGSTKAECKDSKANLRVDKSPRLTRRSGSRIESARHKGRMGNGSRQTITEWLWPGLSLRL
jgi:hypothetical protein